jgi:hypothetical protein
MVQLQLKRFENGGLIVSTKHGRTRVYEWNERNPFLPEVRALLKKAHKFVTPEDKERYFKKRTRPRRQGKPL